MNAYSYLHRGMQLFVLGALLLAMLNTAIISEAQSTCGATYTVVRGDFLRKIAVKCGVTLAALVKANPQIHNINLIFPGQVINIPAAIPVTGSPSVTLSPVSGIAGTKVTVTGSGFPANTALNVAGGPLNAAASVTAAATTDASGKFSLSITIPTSARSGSTWVIVATTQTSGGPSATASFQIMAPSTTGAYTVVAGDTLSKIAVRFNTTINALLRANPQITNSNLIFVGQQIFIPGTLVTINGQKIYFVKQGDTMSKIAASQNVTLATLEKANPQITNPSLIFPGQRVVIP